MSNRAFIAAVGGLGLLAAAFTAGPNTAIASSGEVACEIGANPAAGGVELQGLARAARKLTINYELTIRARGLGNASDMVQSGQVSVVPGQEAVLGTANIGGVGAYTATLKLTWPGGQTACQRSGSA